MKRVLNEVNTLRAREHINITPLLASFSAGDVNTTVKDDMDEYLYMVLPCAKGNLQKWMEYEPPHIEDTSVLQSHIYQIMLSITSGLAFVHKEINEHFSHHHDLKPENILYFESGGEFPIWKISDFGGSSLKNKMDGSGSYYRIGSAPYVPPEYFAKDGQKLGRAFDIFSLGTIILELATLWRYGWKGTKLQTLKDRIAAESSRNTSIVDPPRNRAAYCRAMNTVRDWILELRDDDSRRYHAILDLVDGMLKMQPERRIFAWEVEIDLFSFVGPKQPPHCIIARLESIVQGPDKAITDHNPLVRAREMKRSPEFLQVLIGEKWPENIPGLTEDLQMRSRKNSTYFSTLEVSKDRSPLYGCLEEVRWIEEKFAETSTLGLCGFGGVGYVPLIETSSILKTDFERRKTHIALHYAQRIRNSSDCKMRKHTFWVNADSERRVHESYGDIAREIGSDQISNGWDVSNAVKRWLEDASNGPWFMVIDGFEYSTTMLKLLPHSTSGQVLVTARDRGILDTICSDRDATREVGLPEPEVCLNIFRYYLKDKYDDDDLDGTKELLKTLCLPLIMKMAAIYMNKLRIPVSVMRENFSHEGYTFDYINEIVTSEKREIETPEKIFMELFLRPLFSSNPNPNSSGWPPSLKLLVFLSCLSKDKIEIQLIRANFDKTDHASLETLLATLIDCAFIEKVGGDTYRMLKFIQDGVIAWVRDKKGPKGLFRAFSNALAAILVRYNQKKIEEHGERAGRLHATTYEWKQPFMQHFSRFVQFIKEAKERELPNPLTLEPRAIECLEVFSHAYFEEGRYGDAIDFLEFALKHCDSRYQPEKKTFQIATKLIRTLAKAKIRRASEDDERQAMYLLDDRIKALKEVKSSIQQPDKSEFRLLEWEVVLDLVRICWQCGHYRQAWRSLKDLKLLDFQIKDEKVFFLKEDLIRPLVDSQGKNIRKMMLFAIRARHERGLLQLAEGKQILEQQWILPKWRASRAWNASWRTFAEAKQALTIWDKNEEEEIMDIESSIADVNLMIGSRERLDEAKGLLREHIGKREKLRVSEKSLWDTEYKLAEVLIEGGEPEVQEAIGILTRILGHHDKLFGEENKETKSCANLLRKAHRRAGQSSEISRLEKTYKLHADQINKHGQVQGSVRAGWILCGFSIFVVYFGARRLPLR
jgi:serine/threonine protein kinase